MMTQTKRLLSLVSLVLSTSVITCVADQATEDHSSAAIQHVDPQQAQKLIADKKVVVLDIRTPGEFNSGRIAGAKNIDFQAPNFEQSIDQLDKSKAYLVHCA